MGVGFRLPHMQYVLPKRLLEKYPLDLVPLPEHPDKPDKLPSLAWNNWKFIMRYKDTKDINLIGQRPYYKLPANWTKVWRRHYLAAVTQVDRQLGFVLEALAGSKFANNTIVSFTSDHGFTLGENQEWGKWSNFETALKVPLIIKDLRRSKNTEIVDSPVELIDVFPTLVEMAGLKKMPKCLTKDEIVCTEGKSLLNRPFEEEPLAFSQYTNHRGNIMGYSVRSRDFRYTEWVGFNATSCTPDFENVQDRELYDHRRDPDEYENVVDSVDYAEHASKLAKALRNKMQKLVVREIMAKSSFKRTSY